MTIWIAQELALFNFERLDIFCAWIGSPSEKLWPFEFLDSFCCSISSDSIHDAPESDLRVKGYDHLNFSWASIVQFRASRYITRLNLTSVWKVVTIWISHKLPLFNFYRLYILRAWIWPPCEKLWPFEFSWASVVQFRPSRYITRLNLTSVWKVMTIQKKWRLLILKVKQKMVILLKLELLHHQNFL